MKRETVRIRCQCQNSDHGDRIIELAVPWNDTERSTMRDTTEYTLSKRDVTLNERRVTLNKKVHRTARNNINNAVTNITYDRVHARTVDASIRDAGR